MSAQSIFTDPEKRGLGNTLARDYSAPILELFHENEVKKTLGVFSINIFLFKSFKIWVKFGY